MTGGLYKLVYASVCPGCSSYTCVCGTAAEPVTVDENGVTTYRYTYGPGKPAVCECGSDSVGSPKHSDYCPKH